jgi:hypothetical protein
MGAGQRSGGLNGVVCYGVLAGAALVPGDLAMMHAAVVALTMLWFGVDGAAAEPLAVRCLAPESYQVQPGADLRVQLVQVGDGQALAAPWAEHPVRWMFVRTGGTQDNFDEVPRGGPADGDAALVRVPLAGVAVIGVDLRERALDVPRAQLEDFVAKHASRDGAAAGGAEELVRVRRVESAAALVRAGEVGQEQARSAATGKTGLAAEIRLLMDPVTTAVGGDIAVRIYTRGAGLGNGRVFATALESGRVQEFRVDERGIGFFTLAEKGQWRIEMHHLAAPEGEDEAQWVLYSGTVVFRRE